MKRNLYFLPLITVLSVMGFIQSETNVSADVITDWNQTTIEVIQAEMLVSTKASRVLASVHAAMFDAVNAVNRTHQVFHVNALPSPDASAEAAAACAAYRVLLSLCPGQTETINLALDTTLGSIPGGASKLDGIALGNHVGEMIGEWRMVDHSMDMMSYTPGTDPGQWRPTPPDYMPAMMPQWGNTTSFVLDPADFLLDAPPDLTSEAYATELNQIKSLGAKVSAERTDMQTMTASFWADMPGTVTTVGRWNQIAQDLAENRMYSLEQNARLFALLNVSLADSGIIAWYNKYHYNFWRPVTAIREADTDDNPATEADTLWEPLLTTPAFPEYPSAHSTFSGAAAQLLALFNEGDGFEFTVPSFMNPAMTRTYTSFSSAALEAGMSRLYGGIHFASANVKGIQAGNRVASEVFNRRMQPLHNAAEIRICEPILESGERFSVLARITNAEPSSRNLSEYVVLEVAERFWFWPGWTLTPESVPVLLEPGQVTDQTILEFDWPESAGEINSIRVWAALTDASTGELFGSYDMCEFSSR